MSKPFEGRVALVTGAAGGMGMEIAKLLARRGAAVALADVKADALRQAAEAITGFGGVASAHVCDVSDRAATDGLPKTVVDEHGRLDMLINNAGVALGGTFAQTGHDDFEWLFEINFLGLVRLTRSALPYLLDAGDGRIVNLSSAFGLITPPNQTAYSASKHAVHAFSNALRLELAEAGVTVSTVYPGGVATSIAKDSRPASGMDIDEHRQGIQQFDKALVMPAQKAAQIIVAGIEQGKPRIVVGSDAKLAGLIARLFPVNHWAVLQRLTPKNPATDKNKGHM